MKLNTETSELIRALRLFLIFGLVYVHFGAYPHLTVDPHNGVTGSTHLFSLSVNSFVLFFFLSSVPLLSAISGYLLCWPGPPSLINAMRKRSMTIVAPSLVWTSFWLLVAYVLYTIGHAHHRFTYYDYGFDDPDLLTILNGTIGVTKTPFAIQFWFIHDLILSLICSPLIYWVLKRAAWPYFAAVFGAWAIGWHPPIFFQLKVLSFFSIGIFLAQRQWQPEKRLPWAGVAMLMFLLFILVRLYLPRYFGNVMPMQSAFELLLRATGAYAILGCALIARDKLPSLFKWLAARSGVAYFIFAAHFPLVLQIKQLLGRPSWAATEMGELALWLITPPLTIAVVMFGAKVLQRLLPKLYLFLNGQRTI